MLSQVVRDENGTITPACSAYCAWWLCPEYPSTEDGWALVLVQCFPMQVEAAKQDPRIVLCPLLFDPQPIPAQVAEAYADKGATPTMSMGALISMLAETEPLFATS
jgi:hypothetical protein